MRKSILALAAWCALGLAPASALEFVTASVEQGAAVVNAEDEFTRALGPADTSIRLQRPDGNGSAADVQRLYAGEVRAWSAEEVTRLNAMVARHRARLDALDPWIPDTVLFVKNTDRLDGGLPHTRGAAIFWGPSLPAGDAELDSLFFHELFHIISRANPARQDDLYAIIGFTRCTRLDFPADLRAAMFTNPDAPLVRHVVPQAKPGDGRAFTTPLLLAVPPVFNPASPQFTSYFSVIFIDIQRGADGACEVLQRDGSSAVIANQAAVPMLYAHAGRNTNYIFHPEEMLASNFAQMMTGRADAPDPWVYERLATLLGVTR